MKEMLLSSQKICYPTPGEHAFNSDDKIISKRFDCFLKCNEIGFALFVIYNLPFSIKDADIHASHLQIKSKSAGATNRNRI